MQPLRSVVGDFGRPFLESSFELGNLLHCGGTKGHRKQNGSQARNKGRAPVVHFSVNMIPSHLVLPQNLRVVGRGGPDHFPFKTSLLGVACWFMRGCQTLLTFESIKMVKFCRALTKSPIPGKTFSEHGAAHLSFLS